MEVGYNLVERKLVGEKFEEIKEKMSIVEFLRRLKQKQPINQTIAVTGFEEILLTGEETAGYIRRILSTSVNQLRAHIVQLIIDGSLIINTEPKIKVPTQEIRLTPIFGNRLTMKTIGYFHSPPNI
jgi:predicted regulator of amino acid metabolism with ACT domain